jgi:hypothetical protein
MTDANSIQPHLKVVAGNPTPEELAIVVSLLQAAQASAASEPTKLRTPESNWSRNASMLRGPVVPGHNQWQASFRSGLN